MYVDIYDYFDRWSATYIVYHSSHLREYGDVAAATTLFNARYQEEKADIERRAQQNEINAIKSQITSQSDSASGALKIVDRLQKGTLLSDTINDIAEAINAGIDASSGTVNFDNYNQIMQQSKDFGQMLSGSPQVQQVNDFFNLLLEALNQAQWLNLAVLDALSGIGKNLIGTDFAIDQSWSNVAQMATNQDIGEAQKVINALNRAAQKMSSSGSVDARSFAQTIRYIFSSVIGDQINRVIVANGIALADEELERTIDREIKRSNGKLKRITSQDKKYTNTVNIKLFDRSEFQLKVRGNGNQNITIEIANSSDLSWYKKKQSNPISVHREMNLRDYFVDPQERYLAYNMIAHRNSGEDFQQAFESIEEAVAASFLGEWLQGGQISTVTKNVQFVVVRGKIYPVAKIIENICNSLVRTRGGSNSAFQMNISVEDNINTWQGEGPNWDYAMKRSDMINEIMNTFIIAGTLNSNILTQYAY